MDLSILQSMIPNVAAWLHVEPATVLFWLTAIVTGANLAARLIPDDQIGAWGRVRDICKVIGIYAQNRVTTGVKASDVLKEIVGSRVEAEAHERIQDLASDNESLIPAVTEVPILTPFERFRAVAESNPLDSTEDPKDAR